MYQQLDAQPEGKLLHITLFFHLGQTGFILSFRNILASRTKMETENQCGKKQDKVKLQDTDVINLFSRSVPSIPVTFLYGPFHRNGNSDLITAEQKSSQKMGKKGWEVPGRGCWLLSEDFTTSATAAAGDASQLHKADHYW